MPAVAEKKPELPYFQSRRFVLPDFDAFGLWMMGRLKEKQDDLPERKALGWLKGVSSSNEHLFITNEKAILLAEQTHTQMNPVPKIQEIFCFCQDGCLDYGASLYVDLLRWAHAMGARELIVGRATDVPQPMIEEIIGHKLQARRVLYTRLD